MSTDRSDAERPLHLLLALLTTAAGVGLLVVAGLLAARFGLGLKGSVAAGTVLLALPALVALSADAPARRAALGAALVRRSVAFSVALGATLWVGSLGLMEVQSLFAPPPPEYLETFRSLHAALAPSGALDGLVSVAVIAVLPALCEELVVRGVLLPALVAAAGPVPAVALSALLFALMHLDPYRFLFTLSLGLVFGTLRLRTGSLWPPVLAHLTLNTLTFLVAPLVDDPNQPYVPQPVLGAVCLITGVAASWPLLRALFARSVRSAAA